MEPARKPRAAVFDWDGTLCPDYTIMPWIKFLVTKSLFAPESVTRMERLFDGFKSKAVDEEQLCLQAATIYGEGLTGKHCKAVDAAATEFAVRQKPELHNFAEPLISLLMRSGVSCVVVSGAPLEVLNAHCQILALDNVFGLELKRAASETFSSEVLMNCGLSETKAATVSQLSEEFDIQFGFGNSIRDIPILTGARNGVVVSAQPQTFPTHIRSSLNFSAPETILSIVEELLEESGRGNW